MAGYTRICDKGPRGTQAQGRGDKELRQTQDRTGQDRRIGQWLHSVLIFTQKSIAKHSKTYRSV